MENSLTDMLRKELKQKGAFAIAAEAATVLILGSATIYGLLLLAEVMK